MIDIDTQNKIAILIDAENIPSNKLQAILEEMAVHGHIVTKRAYGDFSSEKLKAWKSVLNENAVSPIQQFSYTQGKNSSDSAMIIDAMDLLYTEKYNTFVLVSSDSDFTKLASRLRESQKYVFGVGEKKTPSSFVSACDEFIYIENLQKEYISNTKVDGQSKLYSKEAKRIFADYNSDITDNKMTDSQFQTIYTLLNNAYEIYAGDDGWALVSAAGSLFKRQNPGFDTRDFGFKKLSDILTHLSNFFEIKNPNYSGLGGQMMYRPIKK